MKLSEISLIPVPKSVRDPDGGTVRVIPAVSVGCPEFESCAALLRECYGKAYLVGGYTLGVGNGKGGILLQKMEELRPDGYRFRAEGDAVTLLASTVQGMLYAVATALQLLTPDGDFVSCPAVEIEDYPDKPYRALMVDVQNAFRPVRTIRKYIDVCFLYKISYLHLHFLDNAAYTLPSKVLPKLPTVGRSYTFEDIAEINRYAKERGVTIIPEFEVPGHAKCFTRAYPEIFLNQTEKGETAAAMRSEIGTVISSEDVICVGSERADQVLRALLAEVCEMFPDSPYIHIGGDEANALAWEHCPVCQRYRKARRLNDTGELYSEFVGRMAQTVIDLGRTPVVWEGFPARGAHLVPKQTIVCSWESHYISQKELLDAGFRITNGSWQPLYIVPGGTERWDTNDILAWDVCNWQHWWTESEASLNPIHIEPTDKLLGAQISSWGLSYEQDINFVMENLSALSERTWTTRRYCTDAEFNKKQRKLLKLTSRILLDLN